MIFSLHKIKDRNNIPFDPTEYSKFKFGCKDVAKKFGKELAKAFIVRNISDSSLQKQIVVASSPYLFIPTATFAMKDYFIQELNSYLVKLGRPVVQEIKIYRNSTYSEDYGKLDAKERMKLIGADKFYFDANFCFDKTVLFLDDIKITGTHEKLIVNTLISNTGIDWEEHKNNFHFLYFAELVNKDIHPDIENYLNYYYVKSLLDLDKIIKNENFLLNTRTVKYILHSNFEDFKNFINYQSAKFISNVYHQAIGNSYHTIPEYSKNLNYIKKLL